MNPVTDKFALKDNNLAHKGKVVDDFIFLLFFIKLGDKLNK